MATKADDLDKAVRAFLLAMKDCGHTGPQVRDVLSGLGFVYVGGDEPCWLAMVYAPLDGTEVDLLLHHPNHRYAKGDERKQWEQVVRAKWIDFNGGGWTWRGMYGTPMGWRPVGLLAFQPDSTPGVPPTDQTQQEKP